MAPGGLLLLLTVARAQAQEGPDVAPPAPEVAPEPLGARFVWERRPSVSPGLRLADLAVQPVAQGVWVAVDTRGGVWLSEDEGTAWDNVLAGIGVGDDAEDLPDDEELLLEAESRRDEALDGLDEGELYEPTAAGEASTTEDAPEIEEPEPEEIGVEEAGVEAVDLVTDGAAGERSLPILWVDPTAPDHIYVARADGLWRSDDAGRTWVSYALDADVTFTALYRGPDGVLVGGTTDGVRSSLDDGLTWIDAEDATDHVKIATIVAEAGVLWAGGDGGLFRSANGLQWERVPLPSSAEVRAVVPDPNWDGGFWVASEVALLRTDDNGASFYVAGRQPLRGLREILHLDEPGHLVAISTDGVWESMDGGVAWSTADRLLTDPDVRAFALTDNGPVIATLTGVWRMVKPREVTEVRAVRGLSLPATIEASVTRSGMRIDPISVSRLGIVATLMPQLDLGFDWGSSASRRADLASDSTTDSFDDDWSATAKLCWGACSSTVYIVEGGELEVDYSDRGFYVFDGEVYDEGEPVAAASNVAERIRSYRRYLADHVADAWLSRARLVAESKSVRALPLREQVLHALQIQELDARLDALTDGAFSRTRSETDSEESR